VAAPAEIPPPDSALRICCIALTPAATVDAILIPACID